METDRKADLVRWTGIEEDEQPIEAAAKLLQWFLDTNWHESWTVPDATAMSDYAEKIIADLRALK